MRIAKDFATQLVKNDVCIVSGYANGIDMVIEAGETGGSLDAGLQTLGFGKPLFVPVFSQLPSSAKGNDILFAKGAKSIRQKRETSKSNIDGLLAALQFSVRGT